MAKKRKLNKKPDQSETSRNPNSEAAHPDLESLQKLLEPFSKDQLIEFICSAALAEDSFFEKIRGTADKDVSHRKMFVYGLGWDATREDLIAAFKKHGEIEECNVVMDRVTARCKGYGFVLYKHRKAAVKALKEPQKMIKNRLASYQLASIGPVGAQQPQDVGNRKIYISNVPAEATAEKLAAFFGKFGELESGPIGFDVATGKSRGYALFIYKTVDGAKNAMAQPIKMFDGHQVHVTKAAEYPKGSKPPAPTVQMHAQQPAVTNLMAMPQVSHALAGGMQIAQAPSLTPLPMVSASYGGIGGQPYGGMGGQQVYAHNLASGFASQQAAGGLTGLTSMTGLGHQPVFGAYSMQGLQQSGHIGQGAVRNPLAGGGMGTMNPYGTL